MALYTILNHSKIKEIAKKYRFDSISNIQGIKEGTVNTYYKFKHNHQNYFLKIDEVGSRLRLKKELKILKLIQNINIDAQTPYPLKTLTNQSFLPLKNKFLLLFPEISGQSISEADLKPKHLFEIGLNLAKIHLSTKNISLSMHRFNFTELNRVFLEIDTKLLKKNPEVHQKVKSNFSWLKNNRPPKLPHGLIHADLFPENILFLNHKISGILDFEASGKGAFLFDIMVTIHACCFKNNILNSLRLKSFLEGYQSIRKISPIERKNATYFFRESTMRFLLTRLRDFELKSEKVKASPFKDYREFLDRLKYEKKIIDSL